MIESYLPASERKNSIVIGMKYFGIVPVCRVAFFKAAVAVIVSSPASGHFMIKYRKT